MEYRELKPSAHFAGSIKRFWSLEYDSTPGIEPEPELVLPDGCPEMVFNLADRFRRIDVEPGEIQPSALFAGQMSRSIRIIPTGRVKLFGVRFHPAGAGPMFRFPASDAAGHILDAESCLGKTGIELEEKLAEASSMESRVELFERFYETRAAGALRANDAIEFSVKEIERTNGSIAVAGLIEKTGISERTFQRNFRAQVGITPKRFARIVRFQSLIRKIRNAETPEFLDASLDLGYFDQSHAIREFREFSGTTPMAYFQMTHDLSDLFTA